MAKKPITEKHRKLLSERTKELWTRPEYREKMSTALKARWEDPDYRARMKFSDAGLASLRDALTERWADPDHREMMQAAQSKGTTAAWADPVRKAARLEKRRATELAKLNAEKEKENS